MPSAVEENNYIQHSLLTVHSSSVECLIPTDLELWYLCVSDGPHGLFPLSICVYMDSMECRGTEGRRVGHCQQTWDREKDDILFVILC